MNEKGQPPAPRLEPFEALASRYEGFDPAAMHAYVMFRRASLKLDDVLTDHFGKYNLSSGRFLLMAHLMRAEGHSLSPAQLAELCGITRATITGLIDTLEKSDFVAREEDPDDRRSVQVRLTITGRRMMLGILPDHFKWLMKLMNVLSPSELKTLQTLSEKIANSAIAMRDE